MIRLKELHLKWKNNKESMPKGSKEYEERHKLMRSQNADARRKKENDENACIQILFKTTL